MKCKEIKHFCETYRMLGEEACYNCLALQEAQARFDEMFKAYGLQENDVDSKVIANSILLADVQRRKL